ncbi:urea transporter [Bacillus sp. FJAT-50079]|uniref:urea transporter n=1 Tax=Bacillus sp. FJAT-50079 TaxID=2833577 RepID=UPI001BCA597B|nr:urea transporter [Bacillus sp. FJAT-50079]MBS4208464.1 urea transporter [Bacillus sp. FJAT-50079]
MQYKLDKFFNSNHYLSLIPATLNGVSQVILLENPVSGLIILLGLSIASPSLGLIAFIASAIGTLVADFGGADKKQVHQGLFGFNSVLTGIAIMIFMEGSLRWVIAMAGAAVAALLTAAFMHAAKKFAYPVLTFPFIILTWFLLLSAYRFTAFQLSSDLVPQSLSQWVLDIEGTPQLFRGLIKGVAEVFLIDVFWSGVFILIAVFWAGWKYGVYTLFATAVSWLVAYLLGADFKLLNLGLYSYNAVLTMIAIGSVYNVRQRKFPFAGTLAAMASVLVTASVDTWLLPFGLPPLTLPFVLCTWLFIGSRKVLRNF